MNEYIDLIVTYSPYAASISLYIWMYSNVREVLPNHLLRLMQIACFTLIGSILVSSFGIIAIPDITIIVIGGLILAIGWIAWEQLEMPMLLRIAAFLLAPAMAIAAIGFIVGYKLTQMHTRQSSTQ